MFSRSEPNFSTNSLRTSTELRAQFAREAAQRKQRKIRRVAAQPHFHKLVNNSPDDNKLLDIASTNKKTLDTKIVTRKAGTHNKLVDPSDKTEAMDISNSCGSVSEISILRENSPIIASIMKNMASKCVNKSVSFSDSWIMCESGNVKQTMKKDTPNNPTVNHLIVHHVNKAEPSVVEQCAVIAKKLKARRTRRINRTVPLLKRRTQPGHKCKQCNKKFRTVKFLTEHYARRHEFTILVT